jgi:crossover junction endodeoxyribonuclease RuvC
MIVVGVDPGLGGAFVYFDGASGALISIAHMPVLELVKAGKKSRVVDPYRIVELLSHEDIGHAVVETAQTRPGQSAQATGKTFVGYGILLGVIAAHGIPVTHRPEGLEGRLESSGEQNGARARASELIPGGAVHWPLVKHDGRAEAALIGLWGLRQLSVAAA